MLNTCHYIIAENQFITSRATGVEYLNSLAANDTGAIRLRQSCHWNYFVPLGNKPVGKVDAATAQLSSCWLCLCEHRLCKGNECQTASDD